MGNIFRFILICGHINQCIGNADDIYYALILLQEIIIEILKCVYENLNYMCSEYSRQEQEFIINSKREELLLS